MRRLVYIMALLAMVLAASAIAECDYYVGDTDTMPQITPTRTIDINPADGHLLYLYGGYAIEADKSAMMTQLTAQAYPDPAVVHTFNTAGTVNYAVAVMYAELNWDTATHAWIQTSSGVDSQIDTDYTICEIGAPSASFLQSIWVALMRALCDVFPHFGGCRIMPA